MQTRCRLVRYRDLRPLLDLLCRLTVSESDDTLIFMEGEETQVINLKNILQTFSISTGLKVNYFKSMLVLINISDEETLTLTVFWLLHWLLALYLPWPPPWSHKAKGD